MTRVSLAGIPGDLSPEAARIRWIRAKDDPLTGSRVYQADVDDGQLRALVSRDAAGKDGRLLWHLSVSHRDHEKTPDRLPSWDELKHAAYRLVQADIEMVLVFPRRSEKFVNLHPTTIHLWEAES